MSSARDRGPSVGEGDRARRSFTGLTLRQRILLVLILAMVPIVVLGVVELGLRLGGYGSGFPLFVPAEPAPEYLVPNPEIARRYFRFEGAAPVPLADLFRAEKRPGSYRIFVQGASTTAGFPYNHGGAFSRMLEQRLQATFPGTEIEVVNVALDATNSYTLLDQAPEILEQRPDAVLLYAGHNEYYGVLGVASAEAVGRARWLVRTYMALRRLRTVQWLGNAAEYVAGIARRVLDAPTPPRRTLMEYLASEHTVRYDSPLHEAGQRQLRRNLNDLLRLYAEAGVPVFIGTLASNDRGQPPFISRPASAVDSVAWARLLDRARRTVAVGDTAAARAAIDSALVMDPAVGDPFYVRGRLLDETGDSVEARAAYRAARDRDQLPFRAPSVMNAIIRETAGRHGATVVETLDALAEVCPGGVVDNTIMLEHLHPTIDGQFLLADAFYRALREAGEIGDWAGAVPREAARTQVPVTAVDSLAGSYTIARLTSGFPFQPAGSEPATLVDTIQPGPIEEIALAYHRGRLPWLQAMGRLQEHYREAGEWERVAHVTRVTAQEVAYSPTPLLMAAEAAGRAGLHDQARRDLAAAQARRPTAEGARIAGNIAVVDGDSAAARGHYQEAVRLDAANRRARAALQALRAIPELERTVQEDPGDVDALANLGITYFLTGQFERAEALAARALRIAPDHAGAIQLARQLGTLPQSGNE